MTATTHLGITLVEQSQAQKEITVNEALTRIDAVLNSGAISKSVNTPPGSPSSGDMYIVGTSPIGDWAGKAKQIAYYDQMWRFIVPLEGMLLVINDENTLYNFDGSDWVTSISSGSTVTLSGVVSGTGTGSVSTSFSTASVPYFGDAISGLTLTVNAGDPNHDIDFGTGFCIDSTRNFTLRLTSGLTKQLDMSWATGTNAGGLFSGSIASNTTYHCFIIRNSSDGSLDAGYDTSVTAANIPSGYTAYRRIGSIMTDDSSAIIGFIQNGDYFALITPTLDTVANNPGLSAVTETLNYIPTGIVVDAYINGSILDTSATAAVLAASFTSLDTTDISPGSSLADIATRAPSGGIAQDSCNLRVKTNSSAQIRYRVSQSNADITLWIAVLGWYDRRAL